MNVMFAPRQGGIWRSVDTTIHSLRGRLATLLQISVTLLSCFVVKFISWVLKTNFISFQCYLRINGLGKGLLYKLIYVRAQEVLYVGYHRNYRRREWGQGCRS